MARDTVGRRLVVVNTENPFRPPRPLTGPLTDAEASLWNPVMSTDGRTVYYHNRHGLWSVPAGGGSPRQVVRFDDPLHPHALNARNFAEHAGWIYFTLQDPQSNIWVAPVTGLAQ